MWEGQGAGWEGSRHTAAAQQDTPEARPAFSKPPLLPPASPCGRTGSPGAEDARAAGSWCGSGGPSGLIRPRVHVGPRQRRRVQGHGHGGGHSGKALGQRLGQPPPKPSALWSRGAPHLWALLVHLQHLWEGHRPQ